MEAGEEFDIARKGLFARTWEITNTHGGRVGAFRTLRRFGYFKGEGEAAGATRTFRYAQWGLAHGEVCDEWGHVVGTMHRSLFSRESQLILYEKEYVWRTNSAGTVFTITLTDGTVLVRVEGCGGFGTAGMITVHTSADVGEILTLVYMGLFQLRAREAEVGLVSGVFTGLALFGGTKLFW